MELSKLTTEQRNQNTLMIDVVSTHEMLEMINDEDAKAAAAVRAELGKIARAVDVIARQMKDDGRLFYVGAGTSGRLGILDASEVPPTFGMPHGKVIAIIAGGKEAVFKAVEGAEDDAALGARDIKENGVRPGDVVAGIAASGRTPYVLGAVEAARELGAVTIGISNAEGSVLASKCHYDITPIAGPEALTGSTRMKAGTMQKMVLNMLTTGVMIKLGKTYGNLMVDVMPTNEKLADRAARIVQEATGADCESAITALRASGMKPKTAIVMIKMNLTAEQAAELLVKNDGFISKAVEHDN
ncbi:MAG: N-acetylmuramic acid 6-phosphate etherase [Defluviitaleaceae bacterium]|nr:N-acetylmuramic acid 6-phosphate etherase [Defluviitaleaceae bacterium]MCL2837012.1 N-acetylmuramic acid 6-phosphate etherase [Defluviitaleaceae bacterium]